MASYSVIVCTYNGESFLAEQLDSILRQTLPPQEIVVVDDSSKDRTLEILNSYKLRHPSLKIYQNAQNLGVIKNFERGINEGTGDFIFLADQDDIWLPEKIECFDRVIKESNIAAEDIFLAFSDLEVITHDGQVIAESFWRMNGFSFPAEKNKLFVNLFTRNFVPGCSCVISHGLKSLALPFPSAIGMHDHWLSLVAVCFGQIRRLPERLVKYRQHDQNVVGASQHYLLGKLKSVFGSQNAKSAFLRNQQSKMAQYDGLLQIARTPIGFDLRGIKKALQDIEHGGITGCWSAYTSGFFPTSMRDRGLFFYSVMRHFFRRDQVKID